MPYTEEQVRLATIHAQLKSLKETADDLWSVADFADSTTFNREDGVPTQGVVFNAGMAYSQALQRPSATACAYINEMQLRMLRARSRAFAIANPYWKSVSENRISYGVGTGHVWSVVPRHKGKELPDELKWLVTEELENFARLNKYRRRQGEKLNRLDRDGEYFLRFFDNRPDGILRVRFVEPLLVQTPPGYGAEGDVWFGIGFKDGDYETPDRYYIRSSSYDGSLTDQMQAEWRRGVPADEIQHRTANVDLGSPRGLPSTYAIQDSLMQAVSTLKSMGRLVDVRARIAVIRKQVNATLGQIQPLLLKNRSGQSQQGNQMRNAFQFPYGTVLDTNDQRTYEFPSQNVETDKIVHSLKSDLQAAAAAMGLADFTISGDSSTGFASALVKEGPMDRAICRLQQDLIEDDEQVYERALVVAAQNRRLPEDILELVRIDIMPPPVIARNRIQETQADEILVRNGAMSSETMAMRHGMDPEQERQKAAENPSPALDPDKPAAQGSGDTRSHQAAMSGKVTVRGVPSGMEAGPLANPSRAAESIQEAAKPTNEEQAMAAVWITDDWLNTVKAAILALPAMAGSPKDMGVRTELEPGIEGVMLGLVDGKRVWAVDMSALSVKHDIEEMPVAGNSAYEEWLPEGTIVVDWRLKPSDLSVWICHEVIEAVLMSKGKWSNARAHRYALAQQRKWLLELRPELQALVSVAN